MSLPPASLLAPLLSVAVVCRGQPILPSINYPVFIFTPPEAIQNQGQAHEGLQYHPHPDNQFQTTSDQALPYSQPQNQDGYEVTQFHSQDELGRVVYGFHGPDQSRMEARSMDGSVRGSYSYIDPNGNIVRMQYWDDGSGFHVTGNTLPNGHPAYTPEVAAARAQHLKIYQATLEAAGHFVPPVVSDGSDDSLHMSGIPHFGENIHQFDKETNTNHLFSEDTDSVSLDNPEIINNYNFPEEEKEDDKKTSISDVEGEVELGEDVGPDDEESDVAVLDNEEQDDGKEAGVNYFNNNENEENIESKLTYPLRGGNRNEDVPKKFFQKDRFPSLKSHDKESSIEEGRQENGDEQDDDVKSDDENDHEHEINAASEEKNKNRHHEDENEENKEHDEEEENLEENVDEHFDTVEHLFHTDDEEGLYRRAGSSRKGGKEESEENYESGEENSDAETAENRKALSSMKLESSNPQEKSGGREGDQLFHGTNMSPYMSQPKKAFFYQYFHTIPKPIERVDLTNEQAFGGTAEARSLSQLNSNGQASSIQAPSIVQPLQTTHLRPELDAVQEPSSMVMKSSQHQPISLISQLSEIHDPQMSPYQAKIRPHILPVFLPQKER